MGCQNGGVSILGAIHHGTRRIDRWAWGFLGVAMLTLVIVTVDTVLVLQQPGPFAPISYSAQVIERVNEDGTLSLPTVEGFEGPAIRLGDTVPVRGVRMNDSDRDVSILGNVVWSEDPPGERFVQYAALNVLEPGGVQAAFLTPTFWIVP